MSYGRVRRGRMAADEYGTHFTQVYNAFARDTRITGTAKAVFLVISTHRDGYGISVESLCTQMKEGPSAIKAALRCLEQYGYLVRTRTRDPKTNRLSGSVYEITDMPDGLDIHVGKPYATPEPQPSATDDTDAGRSSRSGPPAENPPEDIPPVDDPPEDDRPHKKNKPKNTRGKNNHPPSGGGGAQARPPARDTSQEQPAQDTIDGEPAAPPTRKRRKRTTPWPGRFVPTEAQRAWAAKHYPAADIDAETAAFNAHWDAQPDAVGDWPARWRKWMENTARYGPSKPVLAPPDELEKRRVEKISGGWWARYEGRPVMTGTRAELERLVLQALRAGASDSDVTRALVRCAEPVPHPKRFERALLGEPMGWNGTGNRPANLGPDQAYNPDDDVHAERRRYFG